MPVNRTPETRPSLILRLRNRDDLRAWQEFVELYEPLIRALATKRGLQNADVDDVTQEVMTRVARALDDWEPDPNKGSFRGWLATITRNVAVQCFREIRRRPSVGLTTSEEDSLTTEVTGEPDFDTEHERQLFAWAARKVQDRFHARTWQAFWETAVEGKRVVQIAASLNMTPAQVHVSRCRVMKLLRQTIERSQFDSQLDWRVK